MTLGSLSRSLPSASIPSSAWNTSKPAFSRCHERRLRMDGLSSTSKTQFSEAGGIRSSLIRVRPPRVYCHRADNSILFAQYHAQEAVVNYQRAVDRVIDKAELPKIIHELT